jgi:hypothetical protein
MKKIILSLVSVMFLISTASADLGVNIGITGSTALFVASGNEVQTDADGLQGTQTDSETEIGAFSTGSFFIEKEIGRFALGYDHTPDMFSTDTTETQMSDQRTSTDASVTSSVNTIQVDFDEMNQIYVKAMLTDNLYIRAGAMEIEVVTNENLTTGSVYGNTTLDGTSIGFGYHKEIENMGLFYRIDGQYQTFDAVSLSGGADNTINLKNLDGVVGSISIGKSF